MSCFRRYGLYTHQAWYRRYCNNVCLCFVFCPACHPDVGIESCHKLVERVFQDFMWKTWRPCEQRITLRPNLRSAPHQMSIIQFSMETNVRLSWNITDQGRKYAISAIVFSHDISPVVWGSQSPKARRLRLSSRYWGIKEHKNWNWFLSLHGSRGDDYWGPLLREIWCVQLWWVWLLKIIEY